MQYADHYIDRRDPRRPRFCKHCKAWKPERTHHCSVMERCVLKMVSRGGVTHNQQQQQQCDNRHWQEQHIQHRGALGGMFCGLSQALGS